MKKYAIALLNLALIFGSVNVKAEDKIIPDFKTTLKQAEKGNAEAQHCLAWMYSNGKGVEKDDKQAVYWYTKAAEQNLPIAQNNLGLMYFEGKGVAKNLDIAKMWLKQACENAYQDSCNAYQAISK
ncbi:tetratricopeptide repeat protein [Acinetobacter sp. c2-A9]|uniref:tetratricopeptide repeat protein n=1 Tax=Acinetobacter sp. c2-A9 TaxID=3342802 RepID=UPI0035B9F83D